MLLVGDYYQASHAKIYRLLYSFHPSMVAPRKDGGRWSLVNNERRACNYVIG